MDIVVIILYVLGFVCFLVSAFGWAPRTGRPALLPLGLAAWILTFIIAWAQAHG